MAETKILTDRINRQQAGTAQPSLPVDNTALNDLKARIHRRLINRVDLEKLGKLEADIAREEVRKVLATLLDEENVPINGSERESITTDVLNEIFGLGPARAVAR